MFRKGHISEATEMLGLEKDTKIHVSKTADQCRPKTLTSESSTLRKDTLTADSANVEGSVQHSLSFPFTCNLILQPKYLAWAARKTKSW